MSDKKLKIVKNDDNEEHFSDDVMVSKTSSQEEAQLAKDIADEIADWSGGAYMADGESYDPDWY